MSSTELNGSMAAEPMAKPPFIRRVRIRGFKSIAFCDVTLEPLTVLVGRNASGKSNFLSAIAFVRDLFSNNLSEAVSRAGGWHSMKCRTDEGHEVGIELEIDSARASNGEFLSLTYALNLKEGPSETVYISRETLKTQSNSVFFRSGSFDPATQRVEYVWGFDHPSIPCNNVPDPHPNHAWLDALASDLFRNLADGIKAITQHNFEPRAVREFHPRNGSDYLNARGSNLASVTESTEMSDRWAIGRANRYLESITQRVRYGGVVDHGGHRFLTFRVDQGSSANSSVEFYAASMSDGTLRAFASLIAVFQSVPPRGSPSLVGIEEPESSLHPAALRALVAAFDEATLRTQVILTSHSPDLLDAAEITPANVRVVDMIDGCTVITPVDSASIGIVKDELNSLGGLERGRQLEPDFEDVERQKRLATAGRGAS